MEKKLIIIGGFLGAGKTTAILNIAKHFMKSGKRIGVVTNDQGSQLVDAYFLRANSLNILSVEGGCFCCNFEEFTQKIVELKKNLDIDILLAEPVGSCTDLIATIFKPLLRNKAPMLGNFSKEFSLSPLSILADPKRVRQLMMEESSGGSGKMFPTEVNYLFDKQLKEASLIVVNKRDTMSQNELNEITDFLRNKYSGIEVLCVNAKTCDGLGAWIARITNEPFRKDMILDIDYTTYAQAEAALGWLNTFCFLTADNAENINEAARYFMENVRTALRSRNAEIAHLKCYCVGQNEYYKASITDISDALDESAVILLPQKEINLIVNARINIEPDILKQICEDEIRNAFNRFTIKTISTESFKPSPPKPTYRLN